MRVLRNPRISAAAVAAVSAFYALIFILTAEHIEFTRILSRGGTLNSVFWNGWSDFLRQGNMKYIGFVYIALAGLILLLSCLKKGEYDEYQTGILEKGLLAAGGITALLFPGAMLLILSDSNYSIEVIMLLAAVHWLLVLGFDLFYTIQYR